MNSEREGGRPRVAAQFPIAFRTVSWSGMLIVYAIQHLSDIPRMNRHSTLGCPARGRAAGVPDGMKKSAAAKVGASLVVRRLMREIRAKPGMPVWRMDDHGRRISLIITRAGRDAIGIEDEAGETQPPVKTRSARPSSATAPAEIRPPLAFVRQRERKFHAAADCR